MEAYNNLSFYAFIAMEVSGHQGAYLSNPSNASNASNIYQVVSSHTTDPKSYKKKRIVKVMMASPRVI